MWGNRRQVFSNFAITSNNANSVQESKLLDDIDQPIEQSLPEVLPDEIPEMPDPAPVENIDN